MLFLLKRDVFLYSWSLLFLFIVLPLLAMFQPETGILALVIGFAIHLFYYDGKSSVNRYIVSLPIKKSTVIRGRYLFILIITIVLMSVQWFVHFLFVYTNSIIEPYLFQWQDMVILLSISLILFALAIPMYYLFRSFMVVVTVQFVIFGVGAMAFSNLLLESKFGDSMGFYIDNKTMFLASWLENTITIQPYMLVSVGAFVCYFLSMKLSEWILIRKVS
ncbi:ABC-2 transporter permease [Aquibacillus rhizosphaerae]|uniref:ABC-2 transporter permease n=1 Tax=Aquibacillus rhizosphaerae TaxID=3051431 RepID=A0ABT7L5F6_9BACI|nr:ABC-2 transporter permease [Aquibacillus sp. LR5S19]MDL4841093.1 ABC-2 transporter permease [Aquibacillus sp. LR5S19]